METLSAIITAALLTAAALPASAATAPTVNKTWVSSTGSDTGSCQLVAPCKTFAYAIGQTNAGGEIDVKDSGAYGAFTIDKNITIVAAGVVASVGAGPNSNGIEIKTFGLKVDIVVLTLNTHLLSSNVGAGVYIDCYQCVISLDHMNIQGNSSGIAVDLASLIVITNCHIASNGNGISASRTAAPIFIGNNTITLNATGLAPGNFYTYGNNIINGNTTVDINNQASLNNATPR